MFLSKYEASYRKKGYQFVAGVDEVGRGPLAGPVVAAAVILPFDLKIPGIIDSKQLSSRKREDLYWEITEKAISFGVARVEIATIEKINILWAALLAMKQAVLQLSPRPEYLLVDGKHKIPSLFIPQMPIVQGDIKCRAIAAASIIAKVARDKMMLSYDKKYPLYGFREHKGYGTQKHMEAIRKYGPSPIHRETFLTRLWES